MVTYDQIFEAFVRYATSRERSDWFDLWILCQRRMTALVLMRSRTLQKPLDAEDLRDLVTDATCRVMHRLRDAPDLDTDAIGRLFWFEELHAFTAYNRSLSRWMRLQKYFSKIFPKRG